MTFPDGLDLGEWGEVRATMDTWGESMVQAGQFAMIDALLVIESYLPPYPEPPVYNPDGVSYLNDKQRRWFFAAVKRGDVKGWRWVEEVVTTYPGFDYIHEFNKQGKVTKTVKIKTREPKVVRRGHVEKFSDGRSGTLGRSWASNVEVAGNEVWGQYGTNVSYAPWVVGPSYPGEFIDGEKKFQAQIHKDRWWQFEVTFEPAINPAWAAFEESMQARAKELLHG